MNTRSLTLSTGLRAAPGFGASVRRGLGRALATLALWHHRSRKRRQLARWASTAGYGFVDGTSITSGDAYEEANKPFWRP